MMKHMIGTGNILHVFGYARGHDRGYPIYRPSPRLGGGRRLYFFDHEGETLWGLSARIVLHVLELAGISVRPA